MRISIALFDRDKLYTSRLTKFLQMHYAKQISVSVFSNEQIFASELKVQYFDMALLDYEAMNLQNHVPDRTVIGLLVKDNSIEEIENIPAIGKYQKTENIYKRIMGIYAENSKGLKVHGHGTRVNTIFFTSAQGGAGTSSLAAAYAIYLANKGEKIFYLNLERFGTPNIFFNGDGQGSFSDAIYALKSRNVNFPIKLKSIVKCDSSGVKFIDGCRNSFDMLELNDAEIEDLLEGIAAVNEYDSIIIDYSDTLTARQLILLKNYADSSIYVNDGSLIGNEKFNRFCEAVRIVEKREGCSILNKMGLVYNRYSSQTSKQLEKVPIARLGGIHRIEGISGRDLVNELSKHEVLSNII